MRIISVADTRWHLWATDELWVQRESAGTCSAGPNSRGNVLSCRLRMRAPAEKCWKLTDQDGQQFRKQVKAAQWSLSISSSVLINHLLKAVKILFHSLSTPSSLTVFSGVSSFKKIKNWINMLTANCHSVSILGCCISFSESLLALPCWKINSLGKELVNALGVMRRNSFSTGYRITSNKNSFFPYLCLTVFRSHCLVHKLCGYGWKK